MYMYAHACICICMCICMYICMHTYSHSHTHNTYSHPHTQTHKQKMYVHTCMHVHIHIYTFTLTYAHTLTNIDANRSSQTKLKPVVIDNYNQHMLGVDKLDQFARYYSFLHKSVKWWRKIFWMLEIAVINSYIIYKKLATSWGQRPMTHKAFCLVLIDHLSAPQTRRRPPPAQNLKKLHDVQRCAEKRWKLLCVKW